MDEEYTYNGKIDATLYSKYLRNQRIKELGFDPYKKKLKHVVCPIIQMKYINNKSQLKKEYRKLCLLYHPDRPNGSHDKFIKLNKQYTELLARL